MLTFKHKNIITKFYVRVSELIREYYDSIIALAT